MTNSTPRVADYAAFLPPDRAAAVREPEQTWWQWRGHRVHIARQRNPDAPVRLMLIHGAGGHSAALWPLVSLLADSGVDIAAVDFPLYGRTVSPDRKAVRYEHWLELLQDCIAAEDDGRPLILFGASIGGMIAFETAGRVAGTGGDRGSVVAVAATCLLDPREDRVRASITRFGWFGLVIAPMLALARGPLARIMFPVRWTAPLKKMSRNPELSQLCMTDNLGGGASVPLGFLASYMGYRHTAPTTVTAPVMLLHPDHDDWTAPELSLRVLERSAAASEVVMLRECGHFPIEEPGLSDLVEAMNRLIRSVSSAGSD